MHRVGCLTCCQGVRGIGPVTSKWIDEYCRYGACWAGLGWAGLAWDEQRPPVSPQQLSDQGASEASHVGVRQCTAKAASGVSAPDAGGYGSRWALLTKCLSRTAAELHAFNAKGHAERAAECGSVQNNEPRCNTNA